MVERQDIDALLISALYGELTPADEKRLATHLESHPADRTALEDLTRARAALHESRILRYQAEPPQSVSALLLQEAARRAPRTPAAEGEGWFARFVRSFVRHPAWAAAAMLVLVVGAAALVSRNTDQQFAETEPVATEGAPANTVSMETAVTAAPAAEPAPAVTGEMDRAAVAPADEFKVGLAMEADDDSKDRAPRREKADQRIGGSKGGDGKLATRNDFTFSDRAGDPPPPPEPKRELKAAEKKKPADSGLELRRREAQPKELEEQGSKFALTDGLTSQGPAPGRAQAPEAPAAGAPAQPTAPTARPATVATPAPPPKASATKAAGNTRDERLASDAAKNEKDKAPNDPNLGWAREQHAALITQVRQNNCGRAASIALSIANRAPAYYAQSVETDRSVKECIAYINSERERDAEQRAQRAKKQRLENDAPAPKRAADQPAKNATSDSVR